MTVIKPLGWREEPIFGSNTGGGFPLESFYWVDFVGTTSLHRFLIRKS